MATGADGRPEGLTIDELADLVGMTVRNVRAHQARGLLPPPEMQGRVGYYGDGHVMQLVLVKLLQTRGMNLRGIQTLLGRGTGYAALVRELSREVREDAPTAPPPMRLQARSVSIMRGISPELPEDLAAAGVLELTADDGFTADPVTLATAAELVRIGVRLETMFELQLEVAGAARRFAEGFGHALREEDPAAPGSEVLSLLGQLSVSAFEAAMTREVERLQQAAADAAPPNSPPE